MIRDQYNIIPVFLAAMLHALVLAGMVFVYDFSKPSHPVIPLAISATLVSEDDLAKAPATKAPPIVEPEPELEPESPPQPDPGEEQRRLEEEQKRLEDLRVEQERIRREKTEEEKRKQQAEAEQKKRDDAERKKREEAERDRREQEAEKKRLEDVERQRLENERLRKEAELATMQQRRDAELDAEQQRMDAMNTKQQQYVRMIENHIYRYWAPPPSAKFGGECVVEVRQAPGGIVLGVAVVNKCNGDEALQRSVESAINAASPLPLPPDASVFDRNLRLILKTEQ